jgi:hypothetical protein
MFLELKQNEITRIPVDKAEYTDLQGITIPATAEVYFWLPLKRLSNQKQIIWVDDTTYDKGLNAKECSYTDSEGLIQKADYSNELKQQCLNYLTSTDWYITREQETGTSTPNKILSKRAKCRELIA